MKVSDIDMVTMNFYFSIAVILVRYYRDELTLDYLYPTAVWDIFSTSLKQY
jgi:hypothetical protein